MKIALFTPLNPVKSGIADYNEEMLSELKKHMDIEIYIKNNYTPSNKKIRKAFKIIPFDSKNFNPKKYDAILYHMGNNYEAHGYIYAALKKFPGVVVLHEYALHGFFAEKFYAARKYKDYALLMKKNYAKTGKKLANDIIKKRIQGVWDTEDAIKYPLNEEIIKHAKAIIVHSNFVKNQVKKQSKKPITKIDHHSHNTRKFKKARKETGFKKNEFVVCSAGYFTKSKRYDTIIQALQELEINNLRYVIVGGNSHSDLRNINRRFKKKLKITGHVSLEKLEKYISASDVCINLRHPTMGESSGSLMRMLSYGKPTIVTNTGWYAELPDQCVIKIEPDIYEKEMIKEFIQNLANKSFRRAIGREAKKYAQKECSIEKCAREYAKFIRKVARK